MTARSIATATLSFGLVSIPVKLYSTKESEEKISFSMLHDADGGKLKQQYACTVCNEVVDREHTVKGYEHAKGQYVTLTAAELDALDAVATETIGIEEFIPDGAVDPLYVEASYYLGPDKGAERAYKLLADALRETASIGIASYSAKGRQHVMVVRPFETGLAVHQLRYAHEVKPWSEVPLAELPETKPADLKLAKQLIARSHHDTFQPDHYRDEVRARVLSLIEQKVAGGELVAPPQVPPGAPIDLVEALKQSLAAAPEPSGKRVATARTGRDRARAVASKRPAARKPAAKAAR